MGEPSLYYPYIKWHSALQSRERHSTICTKSCGAHSTLHPVVGHSELRTTFCSETQSTRDFKCISLKCISASVWSASVWSASVHQSEVHQSEVHQSEVHQSEVHQSEVHQCISLWSEGPVITRINNMWNMECWVRTTGWSAECWVPHYFL